MRKAIKKIRKILTTVLLSLAALTLLFLVALTLPPVQRAMANRLSAAISEALGANVSIGEIHYFPLTTFSINNIVVYDTLGNQAVSLSRIKVDVSPLIYFQETPTLNELSLDSLNIYICHLPDGSLNLASLASKSSADTTATPNIIINHLMVQDGNVAYLARNGQCYSFDKIKLEAADIATTDTLITARIKALLFNDLHNNKDGSLSLRTVVDKERVALKNIYATYASSTLDIDSISASLNTDNKPIPYAYANINSIELSPEFFELTLGHNIGSNNVKFSGVLRSGGKSVSAHDFHLVGGEGTSLWLDADIDQRADFEASRVDVRMHRLQTTAADLAHIVGNDVDFASDHAVGTISAVGTVSGKLADAKVDIGFSSAAGTAHLDAVVGVKRDTTIESTGKLNIDIHKLAPLTSNMLNSLVGAIDFEVEGHPSGRHKVHSHAALQQLEIRDYKYENILLDGFVDDKLFQTIALVEDANGFVYAMAQGDLAAGRYVIDMRVDSLRTGVTNLTPTMKDGIGGLLAHCSLHNEGKRWVGNAELSKCYFIGNDIDTHIETQNINIDINRNIGSILLDGDLVKGRIEGNLDANKLTMVLNNRVNRAIPHLIRGTHKVKESVILDAQLQWTDKLSRLVGLASESVNSRGNGVFTAHVDTSLIDVALKVDTMELAGLTFNDIDASLWAADKFDFQFNTRSTQIPAVGNIGAVNIYSNLKHNNLATNLKWSGKSKCDININTEFEQRGDSMYMHIQTDSTIMALEKSAWAISNSKIDIADKYLKISNFMISQGERYIKIDGEAREQTTDDTIRVQLSKIRMEDLLVERENSKYSVYGDMSLNVGLTDIYDKLGIDCNGGVDRFYVNHDYLGHLDIQTRWKPDSARLNIDLGIISGGKCRARGLGYLDNNSRYFDLMFNIDSVSDGFLNFYLNRAIRDLSGTTSGWLRVHGPLDDLQLHSRLVVHPTIFTVKQTNVTYVFNQNDSIILSPDYMEFKHLRFVDKRGNVGDFHGGIRHTMFSGLKLDVIFDFNKQQVLNTTEANNNTFYGDLTADGRFTVRGTTSNILLGIDAVTQPDCDFYMQPFRKSSLSENNYIQFRSRDSLTVGAEATDLDDLLGGLTTHLHIRITPDARIRAIVNERTNNLMTVRGNGNLDIDVDRNGDMKIFGDYLVNKGTYNFTFGNIVNKRFEIQDGSKITWDGAPMNAMIDLTATYKLKASLYDLVQNQNSSADLKRRVPVQCNMHLTNRLVDPTIKFDIEVPSSQNYSQYTIDQYINSEEEMNRQVFMLLAAGRFYAAQSAGNTQNSQNANSSYLGTTISELLSNQLSDWISQNKYNLGLGVNYRPGDDETNEEYALAVSTEVLNNKIVLSGNVGYGRDASGPSNDGTFIGDFDMEVKLNKNGNLRAKAYTHSNNDVIYETSPTTQGIGISYQEDFNTFGELLHRYWYIISGQRRRDRKAAERQKSEEQ
ncbi:MAG: translocation/assembly module TamB [Bacteroidales bacterium]|nr:translocation/assembly module TamB [Bacteroidales bacterium]